MVMLNSTLSESGVTRSFSQFSPIQSSFLLADASHQSCPSTFIDLVDSYVRRLAHEHSDQPDLVLTKFTGDAETGESSKIERTLTACSFPDDLRDRLRNVRGDLLIGLIRHPLNRVYAAIDSELYLWALPDAKREIDSDYVDLLPLDLAESITHVDMVSIPCSSTLYTQLHIHYLVVASKTTITLYKLEIDPVSKEVTIANQSDDDCVCLLYDNAEIEITAIDCSSSDGRIFFGTQESQLYELEIPSSRQSSGLASLKWVWGIATGQKKPIQYIGAKRICSLIQRSVFSYLFPVLKHDPLCVKRIVSNNTTS
ncbi:hypothetical protein ACOME3_000255 [Neoechinorhynchus agilis]